jgi:hypothetical protein
MPLDKSLNINNDNLVNPYVVVDKNITTLGSSVSTPNRGSTSNQPTVAGIGDFYFNTDINELQLYTSNGWVSAATAPNAPTNVVVTSAPVPYGGQPGVIVSWTPAKTGSPASSYLVTSSVGGFSQATTTNTITFIGLTTGTAYTFTVTAKNDYGSNSTTSSSITPVTVPQTPTIGTPTITAAGLSIAVTPGNNGGSPITSYTLYANPGNIPVTSTTSPVLFNTIVPITGGQITSGNVYTFTATANNIAGQSLTTTISSPEVDTPTFVTNGLICHYDFYRGSYGGSNLATYSEDFTNSIWNKGSTSIAAAPSIVDPFGGNSAYKLISGSGQTGRQNILQTQNGVNGTKYEVSIFVKQAERRYVTLWLDNPTCAEGAYYGSSSTFDLQTGTYPGGNSLAGVTATPYGNGWYRLSVAATPTTNTSINLNLAIGDPNNVIPSYSATGDGVSGVYVFGGQMRFYTQAAGYLKTTSSQINYTTGSTIYDLSGNNYNTSLANFTYSNTSNNGYGSIFFNGTSTSGGTMPNMGSGYAATTVSFWLNRQAGSAGGADMIISGSLGYNYGDGSWSSTYGEWYYPHAITPSFDGSQWHHYTFVNNSNYSYSIYHDGYLEGTYAPGTTGTNNLTSVILANGYGGRYFKGNLGTFSIYTRALSSSEVLQNFNANRTRYGV